MNTNENEALHAAFEKHIKKSFTVINCFSEYTLNRDKDGRYTNLSVSMEWPIFASGWKSGRNYRYKVARRKTL